MVHYGFPIILNMRRNEHETLIATYGLAPHYASANAGYGLMLKKKHK